MDGRELEFWKRIKYSFYATLVFLLIANSMTYRFIQAMFQGFDHNTIYLLQGLLFFGIVFSIMMFPNI
jgi:hypothetical protein